jgi:flagellar hook-associated protein 1 FlgK
MLMPIGDVLGTAISGLLASQRGLATTGHNVANVNTEGYSRQRLDLVTRPPQGSGNGFIGTGVQGANVRRVFDQFLTDQVRTGTTNFGRVDSFYEFSRQVDSLLGDPNGGLAPALQDFFDAVQQLAADPASVPARQVLLSEAEGLEQRFHTLDRRLQELERGVDDRLEVLTTEINALAQGVAKLNRDIVVAEGTAQGRPANDLRDQRDELVRQLAERVDVVTLEQDNGAINVFVGTGQALVVDATALRLDVVPSDFDPTRSEVGLGAGGASVTISDFLHGGELAGVLDFRRDVLDEARNGIGQVAIGLSSMVNTQHRLGLDLDGVLGGDFFSDIATIAPQALPSSQNSLPLAQVGVSVTDPAALTASDYQLDFDGASYTLTRLSDNTVVDTFAAFPRVVEGMSLTLTGATAAGDRFLVQPTKSAARYFALALSEPRQVAAASPLRVQADVANAGTGTVELDAVASASGLPLSAGGGPITLTFDANAVGLGVPGFTLSAPPGGSLAYDPATESAGKTFTLLGFGDVRFTVTGGPQDGDQFILEDNVGGVGDNGNALLLAEQQVTGMLSNGTATYEEIYGRLVAAVGSTTRQAEINRDAQEALLNQVVASREAVSGVNLDEEAANLLRFQQAYEANARLITAADSMFQALLGAVGG